MKGLTLTQPWAHAVAVGLKGWETRSWRTAYRGPLLIHAAAHMPRAARLFAAEEQTLGRLSGRLELGAILALVELTDVRPTEEVELEVGPLERRYGDYTAGRWAWRLEAVKPLEPAFRYRGSLGLWELNPEALPAVWRALRAGDGPQGGGGSESLSGPPAPDTALPSLSAARNSDVFSGGTA